MPSRPGTSRLRSSELRATPGCDTPLGALVTLAQADTAKSEWHESGQTCADDGKCWARHWEAGRRAGQVRQVSRLGKCPGQGAHRVPRQTCAACLALRVVHKERRHRCLLACRLCRPSSHQARRFPVELGLVSAVNRRGAWQVAHPRLESLSAGSDAQRVTQCCGRCGARIERCCVQSERCSAGQCRYELRTLTGAPVRGENAAHLHR